MFTMFSFLVFTALPSLLLLKRQELMFLMCTWWLFAGSAFIQQRDACAAAAVRNWYVACSDERIQRIIRQQWSTAIHHWEVGHAWQLPTSPHLVSFYFILFTWGYVDGPNPNRREDTHATNQLRWIFLVSMRLSFLHSYSSSSQYIEAYKNTAWKPQMEC